MWDSDFAMLLGENDNSPEGDNPDAAQAAMIDTGFLPPVENNQLQLINQTKLQLEINEKQTNSEVLSLMQEVKPLASKALNEDELEQDAAYLPPNVIAVQEALIAGKAKEHDELVDIKSTPLGINASQDNANIAETETDDDEFAEEDAPDGKQIEDHVKAAIIQTPDLAKPRLR